MQKPLSMLAVVLTTILVLAACGDDDGAAPSESEYRARANAICRTGEGEILQGAQESLGDDRSNQAKVRKFVAEIVIPNLQRQIDDLRALTPPEGQADEIAAWLDHTQTGLEKLKADPVEGFTDPSADPFASANAEAAALGLDEC